MSHAGPPAEQDPSVEPSSAEPSSAEPSSAEPSSVGPSFEDATRRLAQIVAELEGGDLPLDRSLALFEEGVRLARGAEQRLDRAERRIEELLGFDAQGKPRVREIGA